ncbi:MAG: hypothetical protein ACOCXM_03015 [Myxococcota bacterium]
MDRNEARDRFSDAFEGALADEERAGFEAALGRDPELRADYEAFAATVRSTHALGRTRPRADLTAGVQDELRRRSRGRYYRDRFSRRPPGHHAVAWVLAGLALVVLSAAWVLYPLLVP